MSRDATISEVVPKAVTFIRRRHGKEAIRPFTSRMTNGSSPNCSCSRPSRVGFLAKPTRPAHGVVFI